MMDGEAWMIGTVRFTLVDATNRYYLEQAISNASEKEHEYWCLVRAYNEHPDFAKLQRQHQAANSKLPKAARTKFVPPFDHVSPESGYIVFKDAKVVIFYSNDLNGTPTEAIMDGSCELAQSICHGVSHVHRWTRVEIMKWTAFLVPAPIVAYNLFMNGVDRMDQLWSTYI